MKKIIIAMCMVFTMMFVFPVQAKFANPIFRTLKNAFLMSLMQFPKTILMVIMYVIPAVLFFTVVQIMPICMMFAQIGAAPLTPDVLIMGV